MVFALPARRQSELASAASSARARSLGTLLVRRLATLLFPPGRARASFGFTMTGLGRGATQRMYLAAAAGAGVAWAFSGVFWLYGRAGIAGLHLPDVATLSIQPTLILFLVVAIRFSITVPLTLPANWVVRLTESRSVAGDHAGVRAAATAVALTVVAALVPLHQSLWDWEATAYHAAVGVLYVGAVVALFFGAQDKYPFAAPYVSGSIKLKSRWLLYLFGLWALTAVPAMFELQVLRYGRYAVLLPAGLAGAVWVLVRWRARREAELPGLVFDEDPEGKPPSLDLFM